MPQQLDRDLFDECALRLKEADTPSPEAAPFFKQFGKDVVDQGQKTRFVPRVEILYWVAVQAVEGKDLSEIPESDTLAAFGATGGGGPSRWLRSARAFTRTRPDLHEPNAPP